MSLFAELKRRNVIRVGVAYAIVSWVIAQIAEFAFENFGAPDWVLKSVVVILLLGLPLALFFAWAFEMTPEGIKREVEVDRSKSIVATTGHKLDRMIIGVLLIALGWFAFDKFYTNAGIEQIPTPTEQIAGNDARQEKSVAVLPFVAMSSGPDDEYFADGLTEEILNSLAQLPELFVTARTSAFSFKGQDLPIQEIATALGVRHIVEGSVRRSGERLRVTAQLIRAEDGFHLWSENYDSTSTDTISVQENIAEQIASVMDVVLDEQKRADMRAAGLRDVEAFTLYQKGLEAYDLAHGEVDTVQGLVEANVFFEQVIERVPTFSQAYLEHSDMYVHLLSDHASGLYQDTLTATEVDEAYATIIADYEAAEQHATSTERRSATDLDLAFVSGDWQGLGRRIERALDEPGCYQSNWLPILGDVFGYSADLFKRSLRMIECDPRVSISWFNAARSALRMGEIEDSLRYSREGIRVAPGGWLETALVRALVSDGQHDEAREVIAGWLRDRIGSIGFSTLVAAHEGDRELHAQLSKDFQAQNSIGDYYWPLMIAAWGGDRDEANRLAAKIDAHSFGYVTLTLLSQWCACGAPFDLSAVPKFAAKLEESGLNWPPAPVMDYPLKRW
jgi:adenylate cyclase